MTALPLPRLIRIIGPAMAMAALALVSALAHAQGYPSRTLTIVVPYPAGGTADALARIVAPQLSKSLGQTVVVDNVSGAAGSLGASKMLQAPADGHTLMVASPSETILVPQTMAGVHYKPEDFQLLAMGMHVPTVLVARANLPQNNVQELLAYARNPANKEISYASVGVGSMPHLAGETFQQLTGAHLLHVPYRGSAPVMQALMSGEVDISFFPAVGPVLGMASTGKAKILGVAGSDRGAVPANYPSLGTEPALKDFAYPAWSSFAAARGVPPERAAKLNKAINDALQTPEVQAWIRETGSQPPPAASLAEAGAFYQSEVTKLVAQVKAAKLQAN